MLELTMTLRRCSVRSLEGGPVHAAAAWALDVGDGAGEEDDEDVCWPLGLVVALPVVEAEGDAAEPPRCEKAITAATTIATTTMKARRATSRRRR
jgi:hypothetical protein